MRVLILAAGYGTRLYPITRNIPKALIPVKGRPLINYIMDKIEALKKVVHINEVVLVSNDRFYRMFEEWSSKHDFTVKVLNDGSTSPENRLGAVGDMRFVVTQYETDDWLIAGSDNFFDWPLEGFVSYSLSHRPFPSIGIYRLQDRMQACRFGVVSVNEDGILEEFEEKPDFPRTDTVAVCLYFFPGASLRYIHEFLRDNQNPDTAGKYIEWLLSRTKVYGYLFEGVWLDIGDKDTLRKVEMIVEE